MKHDCPLTFIKLLTPVHSSSGF